MLLGWTGLVLLCTAQDPARLVYGSAALVASLRGQHCHFATLLIMLSSKPLAASSDLWRPFCRGTKVLVRNRGELCEDHADEQATYEALINGCFGEEHSSPLIRLARFRCSVVSAY